MLLKYDTSSIQRLKPFTCKRSLHFVTRLQWFGSKFSHSWFIVLVPFCGEVSWNTLLPPHPHVYRTKESYRDSNKAERTGTHIETINYVEKFGWNEPKGKLFTSFSMPGPNHSERFYFGFIIPKPLAECTSVRVSGNFQIKHTALICISFSSIFYLKKSLSKKAVVIKSTCLQKIIVPWQHIELWGPQII